MKFRTDFVTNSSSNAFLAFKIKNERLYETLTKIGIRFENVKEGEFDDCMKIVLPSGRSEEIDGTNNYSYPFVTEFQTVSEWLVAFLLWKLKEDPALSDDDEDSIFEWGREVAFAKELVNLFNEHGILHYDPNDPKNRPMDVMDNLKPELHKQFGDMDGDMEYAEIEHCFGGDGDAGPCISLYAKQGKKMYVDYGGGYGPDTLSCNGVTFAISGELKCYEDRDWLIKDIKERGGQVTEKVTEKTDYVICNDIDSGSLEMKMAEALGIPVISELGFIRIFANVDDFTDKEYSDDDEILDEEEIHDAAWNLTFGGGAMWFVLSHGLEPVVMEVWKDGKWITCKEMDEEYKKRVIHEIETAASDDGSDAEDKKASGSKKRGAQNMDLEPGRCPVCGEMCDFITPPIIGEDGNTYHYWCAEIAKINGTVYGSSTRLVNGETIDSDE